jgi:hypothetical protein
MLLPCRDSRNAVAAAETIAELAGAMLLRREMPQPTD